MTAAQRARDEAVRAAVKADPAIQQLVAHYKTAQKTYLDVCKLLATLGGLGCHLLDQFGEGFSPQHNVLSQGAAPVAPAWQAAITALATDADTALPVG